MMWLLVGAGALASFVVYDLFRSDSATAPAPPGPTPVRPPVRPPGPTPVRPPAPPPQPPAPTPVRPPPPSRYVYPIGSAVNAHTSSLGTRPAGINLVKIVNNIPNAEGDYEVIAQDCFFPDMLCSSTRIWQRDIVDR